MLDRLKKLPVPPEIAFFDVGSEVKDNVAVESLDFSRLMVGVGQKIQIQREPAELPRRALSGFARLFQSRRQGSVDVADNVSGHMTRQVLFRTSFDAAGCMFVEVVADADALTADNSFLAKHSGAG